MKVSRIHPRQVDENPASAYLRIGLLNSEYLTGTSTFMANFYHLSRVDPVKYIFEILSLFLWHKAVLDIQKLLLPSHTKSHLVIQYELTSKTGWSLGCV